MPLRYQFMYRLTVSAIATLLALLPSCSRYSDISTWEDRDFLINRTNVAKMSLKKISNMVPTELEKLYGTEYSRVLKATGNPNLARTAGTNLIRKDGWFRDKNRRWVKDTDMFLIDGGLSPEMSETVVMDNNFQIVRQLHWTVTSNSLIKGWRDEECLSAAGSAVHEHDWYLEGNRWKKRGFLEAFQEPEPMIKRPSGAPRLSYIRLVNLTTAQREALKRSNGQSTNTASIRMKIVMDDNFRNAEKVYVDAVIAMELEGDTKSEAIAAGKEALVKAGWFLDNGFWKKADGPE